MKRRPAFALKGQGGFTIIEIIIGTVIGAIVLAVVYNAWILNNNFSVAAAEKSDSQIKTQRLLYNLIEGGKDPLAVTEDVYASFKGLRYAVDLKTSGDGVAFVVYDDNQLKNLVTCYLKVDPADNVQKLFYRRDDYSGGEIVVTAEGGMPVLENVKIFSVTGPANGIVTIKLVYEKTRRFGFGSKVVLENKVKLRNYLGMGGLGGEFPETPSGLAANLHDPENKITLTWAANSEPDLAGYAIYRSTDPYVVDYPLLKSVGKDVTAWDDTGLTNGQGYYYKITAFDTTGNESVPSDPVHSQPWIPQGLAAAPGNGQVELTWSNNNQEGYVLSGGGYNIYRSLSADSGYEVVASLGVEYSYTNTGLTNGATYYYKITARASDGRESDFSGAVSATPVNPDPPPAKPTGLAATPGDGQVFLAWNANTEDDLAGYRIYRSLSLEGEYIYLTEVGKVTAYTDTGLTNGTTYYYKITAFDAGENESEQSDPAWATPCKPVAPVPLDFGRGVWGRYTSVFENNSYIKSDVTINDSVTFSNNADITGNLWTEGDVVFQNNTVIHQNLYTNGSAEISNNGEVVKGNVQAVGSVNLQNNALVSGWVKTEGNVLVKNNAEIKGEVWANGTITVKNNGKTGTRHEHQSQDLDIVLPEFPVLQQEWYQQHADHTYSGDQIFSTAELTGISGIHYVNGNVTISGTYSGLATIVASGNITISQNGYLKPADGDTGSALALLSFANINIDNNANPVKALLYAANTFNLNNNARVYGSVIAGVINVRNNAYIEYNSALVANNPPGIN
ncbi:MAG: prepilin-type N-terminal cleavage/methylation domain-containing protein [Peptococcaceae bacterium]|nr:MAG: prepilin-type N-terminal cleavage/methylation domain-containing protein [Peptococcaceae bacterium]